MRTVGTASASASLAMALLLTACYTRVDDRPRIAVDDEIVAVTEVRHDVLLELSEGPADPEVRFVQEEADVQRFLDSWGFDRSDLGEHDAGYDEAERTDFESWLLFGVAWGRTPFAKLQLNRVYLMDHVVHVELEALHRMAEPPEPPRPQRAEIPHNSPVIIVRCRAESRTVQIHAINRMGWSPETGETIPYEATWAFGGDLRGIKVEVVEEWTFEQMAHPQ